MATSEEIAAMLPLVEEYLTRFQKKWAKPPSGGCEICKDVSQDCLDMAKLELRYLEQYPTYVGIRRLKKIVRISNQYDHWILGCPTCGQFYYSSFESGQITSFEGSDGQPESYGSVWTMSPVTLGEALDVVTGSPYAYLIKKPIEHFDGTLWLKE